MTDVRSVTVRMNADVSKYISDIRRSGQETEKAFTAAQRAASDLQGGIGHLEQETGKLGAASATVAASNKRADEANKLAAGSAEKLSGSNKKATFSYVELGARLASISDDGDNARESLEEVGDAAGLVGAAAAAGLAAAVVVSGSFDKQMSAIAAATHESAAAMDDLRAAALQAGADTVFSSNEAAQGIEELAKAGVLTGDILGGALDGSLALAAAGQLDVGQSAEIAASAMTQFGLTGQDVGHIADLLAAGAGKAQGSVADLGAALNQSGLVAAQTGLSIEETTGTLAAFASAGLTGSDAGTSFKTFLQSLTPVSKEASKAMSAMGFSAYDAEGNFKGMTQVAADLQAGLSTMTVEQQNATLKTIFGADAVRAASLIYQDGATGIQDWIDKTNDAGYAAETSGLLLDNLSGDFEQLKGSLETALIGTGDGAQGPLRGLTQNATELVNAYTSLPGPAHTAVAGVLALTAAVGGGLFVYARWTGAMAGAQASMTGLGLSAQRAALLTKLMTRGMAATAGIGLFAAALATTNRTMRVTETALAGAALGFSVGGPLGAAVGGATGLIAGFAMGQKRAAADVESLSAAFDRQTGKLNDNAATIVATQLQTTGALKLFEEFGVQSSRVTDAVMGNVGAQKELFAALDGADLSIDQAKQLEAYVKIQEGFTAKGKAAVETAEAIGPTTEKTADLTEATLEYGASADEAAQRVKDLAEAIEESRDAARDTAEEFFNLGDSLDDNKVSLGEWITDLEKQGQALKDFRQNAREAADQGLRKGLIAALEEAGPAGAMRLAQLADASKVEISRANKAWKAGQDQVNAYVDTVGGVPDPMLGVDASQALSVLSDVSGRMTALGKMVANVLVHAETKQALSELGSLQRFRFNDKTIFVHTQRVGDGGVDFMSGTGRTKKKRAAGGVVYGEGTATSDSIPARLSNGEYVVKAAAVEHYGVQFFDLANAMAFADGGLASRRAAKNRTASKKASRSLSGFDTDLSISADGASSALDSFRDELGDVRDAFKDAKRDIPDGVLTVLRSLKQQSMAYDGLTATLQSTKDKQVALAGAAAGSFNGDLFGNGLAGLTGQLDADTNDSTAMQAALAKAVVNGLDGGLFEALATSGDLTTGNEIANLDAAGIQALEDKFAARTAAQSSLGKFAGDTVYAAAVATQSADVRAMKVAIERLESRLPGAVRQGAKEGTREGAEKGSRDGTAKREAAADVAAGQGTRTTSRGGGSRRGNGRG